MPQKTTWAKVHSGVDALQSSTLEVPGPGPVCGEQHHVVPQVGAEQTGQVTQVVVVTGKVAAVLILHLRERRGGEGRERERDGLLLRR